MQNYPCTEIRVLSGWEAILHRPEMYIEKRSIYGLHCLFTGLWIGRSPDYMEDWHEFLLWVMAKHKRKLKKHTNTFSMALTMADGDDEKAFEIWSEWYKEWKKGSPTPT